MIEFPWILSATNRESVLEAGQSCLHSNEMLPDLGTKPYAPQGAQESFLWIWCHLLYIYSKGTHQIKKKSLRAISKSKSRKPPLHLGNVGQQVCLRSWLDLSHDRWIIDLRLRHEKNFFLQNENWKRQKPPQKNLFLRFHHRPQKTPTRDIIFTKNFLARPVYALDINWKATWVGHQSMCPRHLLSNLVSLASNDAIYVDIYSFHKKTTWFEHQWMCHGHLLRGHVIWTLKDVSWTFTQRPCDLGTKKFGLDIIWEGTWYGLQRMWPQHLLRDHVISAQNNESARDFGTKKCGLNTCWDSMWFGHQTMWPQHVLKGHVIWAPNNVAWTFTERACELGTKRCGLDIYWESVWFGHQRMWP